MLLEYSHPEWDLNDALQIVRVRVSKEIVVTL